MTTTSPTPLSASADDSAPRPLPLWASIPIILLCLSAGGYIIHWYVGSHLKADEPHLLGDLPARPVPVATNGRRPGGGWMGMFGGGRGIRENNNQGREQFDAFTEKARAAFAVNPNNKNRPLWLNNLSYGPESAYGFVAADVRQTVYAAQRLTRDSDRYAGPLKLTQAQVQQLRQETRLGMAASVADRALLVADLSAYRSAAAKDKPAAQTKLLADLDAVADRSQAATRQAFAEAAAKVNAIVSPDQWKQFKAMGGRP